MKTCLPRPLELEILLHYHCSGVDFERLSAPACKEAVRWLLHESLLKANDDIESTAYSITPRGSAHLQALLCVPLPEQRWETPWEKI